MDIEIPNKDEVGLAVAEVFDAVYKNENEWLLSSLLPIDRKLSPGYKMITYVVEDEMYELCEFLNGFNELAKNTNNEHEQVRIKILTYCHIMEADFPYTVLWNMLRVLNKQKCIWTFYNCDDDGEPKLDKNNNLTVLRFSLEKINVINKLSKKINLKIGDILLKIWQSELRNAFSHSQYFWMGTTFKVSNTISPLSRRDSDIDKHFSYTISQIEELQSCASSYLLTFIESYKFAMKKYKVESPHKIHDGIVYWDSRLKSWKWYEKDAI